jgi:hypothetical protein
MRAAWAIYGRDGLQDAPASLLEQSKAPTTPVGAFDTKMQHPQHASAGAMGFPSRASLARVVAATVNTRQTNPLR